MIPVNPAKLEPILTLEQQVAPLVKPNPSPKLPLKPAHHVLIKCTPMKEQANAQAATLLGPAVKNALQKVAPFKTTPAHAHLQLYKTVGLASNQPSLKTMFQVLNLSTPTNPQAQNISLGMLLWTT